MAGHSKWSNIKHRKAGQDAKRAKVFTKIIRELPSRPGMAAAILKTIRRCGPWLKKPNRLRCRKTPWKER